jgi:anti-sigma regulatory factor (Ser/Thr protein kinase)
VKIEAIKNALDASVIEGEKHLDNEIEHVYASDLMSDVLAFGKPHSILLTGLVNQQAVISAHMAEFRGVVFLRGKTIKDGARKFARDYDLVLLSAQYDMFDACIRLNTIISSELNQPAQSHEEIKREKLLFSHDFVIQGGDFANAGMVSTQVKTILKEIGFDPLLIRRIAISTYEGEMNVVMHARNGKVRLEVSPQMIQVIIDDEGKGIPDVELAMQKGYTTATEEMRSMGFGSGMGLPNIQKNSDELDIKSDVGRGTRVEMRFLI